MPAFDEFNFNINILKKFRESLISSKGSFFNGKSPEYMNIASVNNVIKIFVKETSYYNYGFIFNTNGTTKALERISQSTPLRIYEDFSSHFRFRDANKKNLWEETPEKNKKKIIALKIAQMIIETNNDHKFFGTRPIYFVVGKIKHIEANEEKHYPLFLFECGDIDARKQIIEFETKGFVNFLLDKNILDNQISKMIKGSSISINEDFNSLLVNIKQTLENTNIYDIEFDNTYSAILIVTGFKTEYFDPVWDKILSLKYR